LHDWKKLYIPTLRIDGLNERRSMYPQEEAMASPKGGVLLSAEDAFA
jgi:hypothetical protein